jgi:hypothetical protein
VFSRANLEFGYEEVGGFNSSDHSFFHAFGDCDINQRLTRSDFLRFENNG